MNDKGLYWLKLTDNADSYFRSICDFPDPDTPNRVFDDMRFEDIPIMYITVTKNNTKMVLTNGKG
jgi:hypothetical protein